MKRKNTLFLGILVSISSLTGCGQKETKLPINIGTKLDQIKELKREVDLTALLSSKIGEGVLLATYSKAMSSGCSCWTGFKEEVANKYIKNHNVPIYFFDTDKLSDTTIKKYNIAKLTASDPIFYLFKDGKRVKSYRYGSANSIFSYSKFEKEMSKMLDVPESFKLYYVDEDDLFDASKNHINDAKTVLFTERNACSDCSYILPNYIVPYVKSHDLKQDILIMDIQEYNWNGNNSEDYKGIINKLQLSEASNATFGYGRGYVPTIQYYENGEVKDASVTFNDSLESNGDNYKVSQSYYTEERLQNLNFLKNSQVENKVLFGLDVPAADTDPNYHFWTHEAASKYHTPILEAFLNTYCL